MSVEQAWLKRISTMLAAAVLYSGSPGVVDRMANALSKEAVAKVLNDAQRIVSVGIDRGEVVAQRSSSGQADYVVVTVRTVDRTYTLYGTLPSPGDVEDFTRELEKNIYVARKVGALAMAAVNRAKLGGAQ